MKDFVNWAALAPYLKSLKELKAENQSLKDINKNISNYYIKQSNDLCDVIKELREENEKLKKINQDLDKTFQEYPKNGEEHLQYAKYHFGFGWKDRIEKEFDEIRGSSIRDFYWRRITEMTERCKDLEDQLAQKEKEPMEEKLKIELGFKDVWEDFRRVNSHLRTHTAQIEQILEKLEKNESSSVYDDDSHNDNHNDRYSELLTRIQHFYDFINTNKNDSHQEFVRNTDLEASGRYDGYKYMESMMEELFADFIYIPED